MMDTYLGDDADGLDGLEFMTMAEAGELGHVAIVRQAQRARPGAAAPGVRGVGAPDPGAALRAHQGGGARARGPGGPEQHRVGLWESPDRDAGAAIGANLTGYRLRGALIVSVCVDVVV